MDTLPCSTKEAIAESLKVVTIFEPKPQPAPSLLCELTEVIDIQSPLGEHNHIDLNSFLKLSTGKQGLNYCSPTT